MARLHTSFILGYHGCSAETGEKVLSGRSLDGSDQNYDWLGPGVYFWEADPVRAWEWSDWKVRRKSYSTPFVIGAVIDLGNCLDLLARGSLETLSQAFESLRATHRMSGKPLPQNAAAGSRDEDNLLRFLDCAVIRHLHSILADGDEAPFDSVRGLFIEGGALFPGSGFYKKTHVQVAVRSPNLIKGYFRVPQVEVGE